jgi:RNA polymerase sigma factor (sigma-70 family)
MRNNKQRDKIVLEYYELADKAAKSAWKFKINYDDAYSIALLSLMKAAKHWNRESKFSTFYYRVVTNDFLQELRSRQKEIPMDLGNGVFEVETHPRIEERIDARRSLRKMRNKADELQKSKKRSYQANVAARIPVFIDSILTEYILREACDTAGFSKATGTRLMWIIKKAA